MPRITEAPPLWSVDDVAAYLGVPRTTVYRWNYRGEGPPYIRVGKHARYRRADVEAWLAGRTHRSPTPVA
jgi:excisionase family DNA binding protein